ncbi:hypothetical protein Leryth_016009 [Lithospermum erythrorhizon]|nr:hypothetical protein Leryth_016009 [Lithospermum erythrorhizon]
MNSSIGGPLILTLFVLISCFFLVDSVVPSKQTTSKAAAAKALARKRSIANYYAELEKREFLSAHNKIRYLNKEPPFIWDNKLVLYAKKHFYRRFNDCKMVHSNGPYGENIFWGSGRKWRPINAVRFWADEMKFYNIRSNTCKQGKMCGHYTQIVWKESVRLGCFRGTCKKTT